MREKLAICHGKRRRYSGRVGTFGAAQHTARRMVCLEDVYCLDSGQKMDVADHLWITHGYKLTRLRLSVGDVLTFSAIAMPYYHGLDNDRTLEYSLVRPAAIGVVRAEG